MTHSETSAPALFPVFIKLAGRECLVVGAGQTAQQKIEGLFATGATIAVVAPRATTTVESWARTGRIRWRARAFEPSDLDGIFLVVVATSLPELNQRIFQLASSRGVLCNVVDDPARCDFYYPAVVRRGALQIAISTSGRSPALAQRLRREFELKFDPLNEAWLEELGTLRKRLFEQAMNSEARKRLLHTLASGESFEGFRRGLTEVSPDRPQAESNEHGRVKGSM